MIDDKLLHIEQEVLSLLLNNEDARLLMDQIKPDQFHHPYHQTIYKASLDLFSQNLPIDYTTLNIEIKKNSNLDTNAVMTCLIGLDSCYDLRKFEFNAQIIRDRSKNRRLRKLGQDVLKKIEGNATNSDVIGIIYKSLNDIGEASTTDVRTRSQIMTSINTQVDKVRSGEFEFINLAGIYQLDRFLKIEPGYLVTIAGQSNVGKSFVCSQIAATLGSSQSVLMYSLEMLDEQYIRRVLSTWCGVSATDIKAGKVDRMSQPFIEATENYKNSRIHVCDNASISLIDMEMKALSIKRKEGLDVVIIDHLGLINYGNGRQSDTERIQELMPKLKAMAKKLEVVIVLVSQLKKDSYGGRITLSSLKGSGSIIECSDIILGLYDHDESGKVITVLKNREGIKDVDIRLNLNIDRSKFEPYE